jgi:hypothetical protein
LECLVSQHLGYLGEGGAAHGKVRRGVVAEVVEAEVFDVSFFECRLPGF